MIEDITQVLLAYIPNVIGALLIVPFNQLLSDLFAFLPRLVAAAIVFLVAWLIATVLRFDERVAAEQRAQQEVAQPLLPTSGSPPPAPPTSVEPRTSSLTDILATTVYWLVFFLSLPAILGALGLQALLVPVQQVLTEVLLFLPNLLAAAVILFQALRARQISGVAPTIETPKIETRTKPAEGTTD